MVVGVTTAVATKAADRQSYFDTLDGGEIPDTEMQCAENHNHGQDR